MSYIPPNFQNNDVLNTLMTTIKHTLAGFTVNRECEKEWTCGALSAIFQSKYLRCRFSFNSLSKTSKPIGSSDKGRVLVTCSRLVGVCTGN